MNLLSLLVAVFVTSAVFGRSLDDILDKELSSLTAPTKTGVPEYVTSDNSMSVQRQHVKDTAFAKSSLDKIVGGTEAKQGELPWQASVKYGNGTHSFFKCGAAIIDNLWLLSAAHCFVGSTYEFMVTVGDYNLLAKETNEVTFKVESILNHKLYDPKTTVNDIALLRVNPGSDGKGISFNKFVQPISLINSAASPPVGALLVVSGWGGILRCKNCTSEPQEFPPILKKAEVPAISQEECKRLYSQNTITDRMLCAGWLDGRADACTGDSGGPLVYETAGSKVLAGVVSWAGGCGLENTPGVYTRVSSFLDWIQETKESYVPPAYQLLFK
ncbi:unnamed protein product [Candidula unifasciata]|uniref:Peptidase S1 domain-containing protein n=1 Tax=Candidula unifasciata TaxID=100452 RepID=A0A8S3ZKH3_9EUPU|nr:unnamed protein product [Candidula unifasciata]